MNFRVMSNITGPALCLMLFVDGAFWYGVAFLWVLFMGVAIWLNAEHKRRRRRGRCPAPRHKKRRCGCSRELIAKCLHKPWGRIYYRKRRECPCPRSPSAIWRRTSSNA